MVYLQIETGGQNRRVTVGESPIQIGRLEGNTLVLEDTLISRRHCIISRAPKGFALQDLNSSNGTYVNGERVAQVLLHTGDIISVGRFQIRFVDESQPAAPAVPPPPPPAPPAALTQGADAVGVAEPLAVAGDELDESDLVDDTPDIFQAPPQTEAEQDAELTTTDDFEAVLLRLAESLPDKSFNDYNISLVNARGIVAHPALKAPPPQRTSESGDAVRLLRLILLICFRTNASDIHVEPKENVILVRIRVDGTMVDLVKLDKVVAAKLNSMIKVLSDIDIAQRSIVQEGHFSSRLPDRRVDYRVSFAPSVYGQKMVVRILDAKGAPMRIEQLRLPGWMKEQVIRATEMDTGVMLVCGPTGSGKTTTLYSVLRTLDVGQRNVITIEDPVEIQIPGVTQLPVNDEQGNSFAALLRSVLRQDPDVILVGEIRDPETAKIAMQAAITGHLVFSTLHTKDTIGTIFRLLDLGVEPYLLTQGLNVVLAQRLVRQLCPHCKMPAKLGSEDIEKIKATVPGFEQAFTRRGCPRCMGTGFTGRRAIYELMIANDQLRDAILHNRSNQSIQEALKTTKFMRLAQHGHQLIADGLTSLDEVDRAIGM
jgi:general secretion pathway protein E